MNIEKKAVKLQHFVTIENLSNDDVSALIERAEYFKHGGTPETLTNPVYSVNMFLKIRQERIRVLRWPKENLA